MSAEWNRTNTAGPAATVLTYERTLASYSEHEASLRCQDTVSCQARLLPLLLLLTDTFTLVPAPTSDLADRLFLM